MKQAVLAAVAAVAAPLAAMFLLVTLIAAGGDISSTDPCGAGEQVTGEGAELAARAAVAAGFTGDDLLTAVAVAGAESGYRPDVRNSIGASGLWQILQSASPDLFIRYDWRDPADNAAMAHTIWEDAGRRWTPWTTWTSGAYRRFLPQAQAAIDTLDLDQPFADGNCPPSGVGGGEAAVPFIGPDGYVDDPTTSGRITRRMLHVYQEVLRVFGPWPWGIYCWDLHQWNPRSDHPRGRACDISVGNGGFPNDTDRAKGWKVAHWLKDNAGALGVKYVVWDGRIWSIARTTERWRPYDGSGIYDPNSPTGGHYDHVHVSVL